MNCRHGYFGDTIFPVFGPQEMLYFGVSKPMWWKNMLHQRNQERNWQTGMGSLKVHQELPTFECSLSNTACSTSMWNFGVLLLEVFVHPAIKIMMGAWGGVKRRRFGARIESLGVDFFGDRIPEGRKWPSGNDGRTCFIFWGVVNLFVSSRPLFWGLFHHSKRRSLAVIFQGFRL